MGNISALPHRREMHTEVVAVHDIVTDINRLLNHQKVASFADALSSFLTEHAKHQKYLRKHRRPRRRQQEYEGGGQEAQSSQRRKYHGGRRTPKNTAAHKNEDDDDNESYDEGPYRETQARGPRRSPRQRLPTSGYGNPGFPEDGRGPAPRGYSSNRRPVRPRDPEEGYRSTHPENDVRNGRMSPRRQTGRRRDYPSYARGEEISRERTEWVSPRERREEPESGGMGWADADDRPSADPLGEDNMSSSGRRTRQR